MFVCNHNKNNNLVKFFHALAMGTSDLEGKQNVVFIVIYKYINNVVINYQPLITLQCIHSPNLYLLFYLMNCN